jgi:glycosyltransferase involved in cell wall biosynthesis
MVSGARPEKNNLRAIKALDYLFSNGYLDDLNVKITGVKSGDIYRYKIKNIERFDFLGFVSDEELEQLYHDAYCLVYPSLNEGFGYPPVEAMHYGVPVLASPFTSITEVCADAAIYFNPFSIEEIMGRILFIMNENVRKLYSTKALEQYKKIHLKQEEDLNKLVDYIFSV